MSRITAAIDALTRPADPEATLIAFTIDACTQFPAGEERALDRQQRKQLRRLERAARTALRQPPQAIYSVLSGPTWHIVLAPHAAPERLYLARAGRQLNYQPAENIDAPVEAPATLLAAWTAADQRHRFTHVATPEQLNLLMHYSTANQCIYLSPMAPQTGHAEHFAAKRSISEGSRAKRARKSMGEER